MIQANDLNAIPPWAKTEYKNKQTIYYQIQEKVIKMELNIIDLENMLSKNECPKSLQIKLNIKVNQEQQVAMDNVVAEAKKQFESKVLAALIAARKDELAKLKRESEQMPRHFQNYLTNSFENLANNNVTPTDEEEDITIAIQTGVNTFEKRNKQIEHDLRVQQFFTRQKDEEKKRRREEEIQQKRVDQQLWDPQVKEISEKLEKLEKILKAKTNNIKPQASKNPNLNKKPKQNKEVAQTHPKEKGPRQNYKKRATSRKENESRTNKINRSKYISNNQRSKNQRSKNQNKGNHDRGQGSRRHQRHSTPTMSRSGSRQPNSRKRQN